MSRHDPVAVLAAVDSWIWTPEDARRVETEDYLLVAFPPYLPSPTQVLRTRSERRPQELITEVREHLRGWGREQVVWWVKDGTRPGSLEQALLSADAEPVETLSVLARPIGVPRPVPDDVEVRAVLDREGLVDWYAVQIDAFGGKPPADEDLVRGVEREISGAESGTALNVVAYRAGKPVGAGGVSVADGFARLWGGATVGRSRGRGIYRAVLEARAAWAREHGARAALVKARIETSAPILERAGFTSYGEERSYLLDA